jgi:hypothetical protein
MTAEHQATMPAEHQPPVAPPTPGAPVDAGHASDPLHDPRALQILTTEHWSLLSARSLAYNEAFSRAGMFLSFLSATLIVIGFLIATDSFSEAVLPVVALLLAVDLFIGLATLGRLAGASNEEFTTIRGMNRIRHAYADIVPGIERYFVTPIYDDARGVLSAFGDSSRESPFLGVIHSLTTAIGMLVIIDCVLFAALLSVIAAGLGASTGMAIAVGVLAFLVLFGATTMFGARMALSVVTAPEAIFPTPERDRG